MLADMSEQRTGRRKPWRKGRTPVAPGLGDRIREMREQLGLTQEQVGGGVVSGAYISQVERGATHPSLGALTQIAERLGTTAVALGVAGSEARPTPFRATAEAMALLSLASESANADERDLLRHAEWVLAALLRDLSSAGDEPALESVRTGGLEPPTSAFGGRRSIH